MSEYKLRGCEDPRTGKESLWITKDGQSICPEDLVDDCNEMQSEIERLRAERDEALAKAHEWRAAWEKHHATIGGLRSELDKLRSILNKFDPQTW